jgi:hypothetical protein
MEILLQQLSRMRTQCQPLIPLAVKRKLSNLKKFIPQRALKVERNTATFKFLENVFEDTKPLITSVLQGFNVCIFAVNSYYIVILFAQYGQTGSGKTFTMVFIKFRF